MVAFYIGSEFEDTMKNSDFQYLKEKQIKHKYYKERDEFWKNKIKKVIDRLSQMENETDGIVMYSSEKKILKELIGKEE